MKMPAPVQIHFDQTDSDLALKAEGRLVLLLSETIDTTAGKTVQPLVCDTQCNKKASFREVDGLAIHRPIPANQLALAQKLGFSKGMQYRPK